MLAAQIKLLASFYQIATKIPVVYLVKFPDRVDAVLKSISDLVTLNFDELWSSLQCLQLRGFYNQLLVLMVVPMAVVLIIPFAAAAVIMCRRRHYQHESLARRILLESLPLALIVLFLAYPTVSSYAQTYIAQTCLCLGVFAYVCA